MNCTVPVPVNRSEAAPDPRVVQMKGYQCLSSHRQKKNNAEAWAEIGAARATFGKKE
jgi:hypothetical protein